jgi:hypothetical protein
MPNAGQVASVGLLDRMSTRARGLALLGIDAAY